MFGRALTRGGFWAALIAIALILRLKTRRLFWEAATYILLPVALVTLGITLIGSWNLMHFVGLIILFAIGVDYGIYATQDRHRATERAILYSLGSTLAAFGILIFSKTPALNAIGTVITLGVLGIALALALHYHPPKASHGTP